MSLHRLLPPSPAAKASDTDLTRSLSLVEILTTPQQISDLPAEHIAPLLCQLSTIQNALTVRLIQTQTNLEGWRSQTNGAEDTDPTDRLLTPEQTAAMLGVTVRWIYRHAHQLPFARRLSRKALRFSQAGLTRWIKTRRN